MYMNTRTINKRVASMTANPLQSFFLTTPAAT